MRYEDIYVLVGCEESQAITIEFRKMGIQAFSCDLKPCSGGHPEWHLQMDVFAAIKLRKWHGAIFHPECTYLTVSGLFRNIGNPIRAQKTDDALQFVCDLLNCGIRYIAIENPVGCISTRVFKYVGWFGDEKPVYKVFPRQLTHGGFKPTQTVQPYEFGDDASKRTCFWTIGFPKLKLGKRFPGRIIDGKERWSNQTDSGQNKLPPSENRAELRSKTYAGVASAVAEQYGVFLFNEYNKQP